MSDTPTKTMRELPQRWAELEPDKIEREHWNDLLQIAPVMNLE